MNRALVTAYNLTRAHALKAGSPWALSQSEFDALWTYYWPARRRHRLYLIPLDASIGYSAGNLRIASRSAFRDARLLKEFHEYGSTR